ncbi:MAG TPA: FAD-dependent oxidoreductase [bacterium]|nr:FAD-dependent oxidoreductase [bacterium]
MRALVIGAGVIGASVAYRLARAGADVSLVDRGRPGSGTSAASLAWVNANNKTPRAYHDLNVAGMRAHAALRSEFGAAPWWHGGGNLLIATGPAGAEAVRRRVARLREWDYAAEELTVARAWELEPDLNPEALREAAIAYFAEEGWVDTTVYVHAMVRSALRAGAHLYAGTAVRELTRTGDRVTGVRTGSGETYQADVVVNCAGRWADEVGASAGLGIPMAPNRSLLAVIPPALTRLQRVIHAPDCQFRPDGGGRVMVQADEVDDAVTAAGASEPPADLADALVCRAARWLPDLAGLHVETARIGIRAMPADGHSIVGPQGGVAGYYVVVTHSGVTLAPFLGTVAADELVRDPPDARLASFRPDRFSSA